MIYEKLLSQLYGIHAMTGYEWPMIAFVREYVEKHIPEAEVRMDRLGNLYITKGESGKGYPTLACHMDQVQTIHSDDFKVHQEDDMLYGWSEKNQQREGLGADDKNGIYVCLHCLEECPRLKVFMAVGEEKGCIGSNRADMSFFEDSLYVLEPDCKGGKEIHTVLRGIPCASKDFEEALRPEANGFEITDGKANIPAGYYQPHKDDEYTLLSELEHTLAYIQQTVTRLQERFSHIYKSETQQWAEKEQRTHGTFIKKM